jgi:hypothetical protein
MASKSTTAAKNVYAPLVMMSLGAGYTTLAGNTDFHCGSIDTNFVAPQFRLDSTFNIIWYVQKAPFYVVHFFIYFNILFLCSGDVGWVIPSIHFLKFNTLTPFQW